MKNVTVTTKGSKLIIEVDTSKDFGASASGKSIIIGSTEGNQSIAVGDGTVVVGLNVYRKAVK